MAFCCFGVYSIFSTMDYTEAKKAGQPATQLKSTSECMPPCFESKAFVRPLNESDAEYHARIDRVKIYVLGRQTEALLDMDTKK